MGKQMKRRQFIALLGGTTLAWPLAARAQQPANMPTVGFMGAATPSVASLWVVAFVHRLRQLGWIEGRNRSHEPIYPGRDFVVVGRVHRVIVDL
jgi:hypothetical protein